ncbi:MAG TPA: RnfABCDGE type electron transport complex subunit D [Firmicutes bacterium]|nr:RnfABCDGE type electron transport complex subunit D [Candidatus Fermentithermobacillaceae bacterium]
MADKLLITSSPHIRAAKTVRSIMLDVVIALVPASVAAVVFFGVKAFGVLAASTISAVLAEYLYEKAVKRPVTVGDLSAVVTGLLLGLTLPPAVPLYVPVVGSAFAIVVAKQVFGGLGTNFVNPALAGRAFVLAAWPLHVTSAWLNPLTMDAATGATPLHAFKGGQAAGSLVDLLIGNRLGSLGETSAIAILLGGAYLLMRGVIDYRIPVAYLGTLGLGVFIFGKPGALFQGDPLRGILLGGAMLGAFFMATDYVTSPVTPKGRTYMGIGAGLITLLIRYWGDYPEGVTYAILLMNLATPLIDKFVVPRYYGYAHDVAARRKANRAGGELS